MNANEHKGEIVGPLHKRRETMADGRRYIIYYTFSEGKPQPNKQIRTSTKSEESPSNV